MKAFLVMIATLLFLGMGCVESSMNGAIQSDASVVQEETAPEPAESSGTPVQAQPMEEESGSGTPPLAERIAQYEAEREVCIAQRMKDTADRAFPDTRSIAEHYCTITVMAPKYYAVDPQGMIELCVREDQVSGYAASGGFMAGTTREQLDKWHDLGLELGATIDEDGAIQISEETFQKWREICKRIIELNVKLHALKQGNS